MDYSKYCDADGYPGCKPPNDNMPWDGGDTAAIIGTILALSPDLTKSLLKTLPQICPFDTFYQQPLRHPDFKQWYGQPWHFSRDQLIPMLCGAAMSDLPLDRLYRAHQKRWFLTAWNTFENNGALKTWPANLGDICGPEVWALWIRYFAPWWAPLVLWALDLQTLIGAVQWRWFTPETNQLTRNHMLVSIVMSKRQPSFVSWLVAWVNNPLDLVLRWKASNDATGEFPTASLFANKF